MDRRQPIGAASSSSAKGSFAPRPAQGTLKPVGRGIKRELEPSPPAFPPPPPPAGSAFQPPPPPSAGSVFQGGGRLLPPATAAVTRAWSIAVERQQADKKQQQAERDEQDMRLGAVQLVSSQNMHS